MNKYEIVLEIRTPDWTPDRLRQWLESLGLPATARLLGLRGPYTIKTDHVSHDKNQISAQS